MSTVLLEHGTELNKLKPINIAQAARADLRLLELKREKKADDDRPYSFMRRHVVMARNAVHLIAIAYFARWTLDDTNKRSTHLIYYDKPLLKQTLIELLQSGADDEEEQTG
jgi:hypothetical protein